MKNLWHTLHHLTLGLIVTAVVVGAALKYAPLLKANQAHRAEIQHKRDKVAALEAQHRQLQSGINSLQTDPRAVERAARDILSYARPEEVVVTFEEAKR